jgi:hypothetical protein
MCFPVALRCHMIETPDALDCRRAKFDCTLMAVERKLRQERNGFEGTFNKSSGGELESRL